MKKSIKRIFGMALLAGLLVTTFSSCYESHYYGHYHHHTRDWYDRHHQPVPAGVDFNVDVDVHHH
ncbi:MAG TPA: hypothetical protein VNU70_00720 [Puia sp.]|jgi:hypothetical protein|nr:hypothetical protein [Puia sp.]